MSTSSFSDCPSHFLLDQWTLGELENAAVVDVERHIGTCARGPGRLAGRRADEVDFVVDLATLRALQAPTVAVAVAASHGSSSTSPSVSSRGDSSTSRWWQRSRGPALGGLVAAGLAFAVVRGGGDVDTGGRAEIASLPSTNASSPAGVRAKGRARSALYVQDARGVRPLQAGDGASDVVGDDAGHDAGDGSQPARVHPGDTLQVAVTSTVDVFAAVVSQDGPGQVSTYVAADDGGLVRVAAGRNVPLPRATVLDDVAGFETVAVLLCDAPGVQAAALAGIVVGGAPPAGCVVDRHRLEKAERR
jgi:hypothetical protein